MLTYHSVIERKYANISSMMDVVFTHYWASKILYPNTGQCISADLVVLVRALGIVSHIQTDIFTVTDVAMPNYRICIDTTYAHGGTHCY